LLNSAALLTFVKRVSVPFQKQTGNKAQARELRCCPTPPLLGRAQLDCPVVFLQDWQTQDSNSGQEPEHVRRTSRWHLQIVSLPTTCWRHFFRSSLLG